MIGITKERKYIGIKDANGRNICINDIVRVYFGGNHIVGKVGKYTNDGSVNYVVRLLGRTYSYGIDGISDTDKKVEVVGRLP